MTPTNPDRSRSIKWRYLNDAGFHMRVDLAVAAVEDDEGLRFDKHDFSLATLAAAYAIQIEEEALPVPVGSTEYPSVAETCLSDRDLDPFWRSSDD